MVKKTCLMFLVSVFMYIAIPAYANSQTTSDVNVGVSAEDAQKLRQAAVLLGKAFDVEAPAPPKDAQKGTDKAQEKAPPQKSLADVADKGLEMLGGFVSVLSDTLKKMAPEVWRIMVKQQYAKAISLLVVPWGFFIATLIFRHIAKSGFQSGTETKKTEAEMTEEEKNTKREIDGAEAWFVYGIPFVLGFIFGIWGIINLKDAILHAFNPEFYAIQDLLRMVMTKQIN